MRPRKRCAPGRDDRPRARKVQRMGVRPHRNPTGELVQSAPFALADSISNAQAAVQRAVHVLIIDGVTPTLHAHLVAAERALELARWSADYIIAEREASC